MMGDIEAGNVNCVIVKDLSRLGRDYIEAGRLIQKTFPAFLVRFIALTDQFDSLTADDHETSLVLPVKNFVNDSYCRDISNKVRSQQKIKREKGEFVGAFCVYGYRKSDEDRHVLTPDAYAAGIVQRIFAWKLEGCSAGAIARRLNGWGISSPMEYKRRRGENFRTGFAVNISPRWSAVAIRRILTDETYIGNLAQGKEEKINYKVKKSIRKPREAWIRVENTHESIVTKEDFDLAQELLAVDTRAIRGEKKFPMYAGLLFCGDCKRPMVRRRGKERTRLICSSHNRNGSCGRHAVWEETIEDLVLKILQQQVFLLMERECVAARTENLAVSSGEITAGKREIEKLRRELLACQSLQRDMRKDLENGTITREDFLLFGEIYEKQSEALQQMILRQEQMLWVLLQSLREAKERLALAKETLQISGLDRRTLLTFVSRILVYEDRRIYLEFRYGEPFSAIIRKEAG